MSFAVPRSSRRTSGVGDYELTDTARNIGSLLRFGQVLSVNNEQRTCRVKLQEGLETDDLPWITARAGGNVFWAAPSIEETVLILSPSGELNNAVVLPALQTNMNGTWPFDFSDLEFIWGGLGDPRTTVWRWIFADGGILENDAEKNQFRVEQKQSRVYGSELVHTKSEKFIYIDADTEQGIVHIKAPMIKLDGDVHITGQLMQTGRIVGVKKDGAGLKELDLVGDPINLNSNGGVLGLLAGLLGSVAGGALSLGQLGDIMNLNGNLLGGLNGLADNILGASGLQSLFTAANGLNISGIGAAMNLTGSLPVLGEVFNGLGFAGTILEDITTGLPQLIQGVTSGTGLDLTGAFNGLSGLAGAIGTEFNIPALSNLSDSGALGAIAGVIDGGTLTINDVMGVVSSSGLLPQGSDISNAINLALGATDAVLDDDGNLVAGPELLDFAARTGSDVMGALLGGNSDVDAKQIAHKISELGLATNLEALIEAGVDGGDGIGTLISSGAITLAQVLDLNSIFQNDPDAAATAAQAGSGAGSGVQKFFDYFERAAPGQVPRRDMSSAANSDTSPKKGTVKDSATGNYVPDGTVTDVPNAYSDWDTNYA